MQLHDAVSAFLTAKRAANRSPKTIKWYADQLGVFEGWAGDIELASITATQIERYMVAQQSTDIGDATLHARYRSLRSFLNWATDRAYLSANPITPVEEPTQEKTEPKNVTYDEFLLLTGNIPGDSTATWLDHRDRLICHLLFWSGFRSAELIGLWPNDIRLKTHTAKIRSGKGRKQRLVPISPEVPAILTAYLYSRPEWAGPALFVSSNGFGGIRGELTDSGLRQMLRRRCDAVGLPRYLPHSWRHGFAINMLNFGADLSWVSDVMGHEDEKTTRLYTLWLDRTISARFSEVYNRASTR